LELLLDKFTDEAFGVPVCEVHGGVETFCVLKRACPRKCKNNGREQLLLRDGFNCLLERVGFLFALA
jgi:hypothetical protein